MEFLKRCARLTFQPKPLWHWVFVRGSILGIALMLWSLVDNAVLDAKRSPEGFSLSAFQHAAYLHLTNAEYLSRDLLIYLPIGFLFGLLMWAPDYKRAGKSPK